MMMVTCHCGMSERRRAHCEAVHPSIFDATLLLLFRKLPATTGRKWLNNGIIDWVIEGSRLWRSLGKRKREKAEKSISKLKFFTFMYDFSSSSCDLVTFMMSTIVRQAKVQLKFFSSTRRYYRFWHSRVVSCVVSTTWRMNVIKSQSHPIFSGNIDCNREWLKKFRVQLILSISFDEVH